MAIEITEKAAEEFKKIIADKQHDPDSHYLRIGIKGGGCAGFTWLMELTDKVTDHDEQFQQHGVKIVCDPKSYLYINGTTIDFKDELMGRGFTFNNPNASNNCGCGSSFSA